MSHNFNFRLAPLLALLAAMHMLSVRQVQGASLSRVTVTVTNAPVTSNVFYFSSSSGARLLRWTNQFSSTTIQTNLLGTNQSTTNLFFAIANYPTLGTTVRWASSNSIVLSGVSMVATQLGDWCSITTSALSGTNQYDLALPFDTLPETNRTNNANELVYGLDKYATARAMSNWSFLLPTFLGNVSFDTLSIGPGLFRQGGGWSGKQRAAGSLSIMTNDFYVGANSKTGAVTLTLTNAAACSNQLFVIKDEGGNAALSNITVAVQSGDFIDGSPSGKIITNNYGAMFVISRGGTNFFTVQSATGGGEANVLGSPAASNATVKPLALDKVGVTNRMLAVEAGTNMHFTMTGTSVVFNVVSAGGSGLSSLPTGNLLWVDKVNGSDATGVRGRLDKPFASLGMAKTNAVAGDTIMVLPGIYNEHSLHKKAINWHFFNGARYTNSTFGKFFFDECTLGATTNYITGDGVFETDDILLDMCNAGSFIYIEALKLKSRAGPCLRVDTSTLTVKRATIEAQSGIAVETWGDAEVNLDNCKLITREIGSMYANPFSFATAGTNSTLRDCVLISSNTVASINASAACQMRLYGSTMATVTNNEGYIGFLTGSNRFEISDAVR